MKDRNFDDIAEKFSRHIYGTTKGQLRQAILWQDLDVLLASMGPHITRAGCWRRRRANGDPYERSAAIR